MQSKVIGISNAANAFKSGASDLEKRETLWGWASQFMPSPLTIINKQIYGSYYESAGHGLPLDVMKQEMVSKQVRESALIQNTDKKISTK